MYVNIFFLHSRDESDSFQTKSLTVSAEALRYDGEAQVLQRGSTFFSVGGFEFFFSSPSCELQSLPTQHPHTPKVAVASLELESIDKKLMKQKKNTASE